MKTFILSFKGHYLGGTAVVCAESVEAATALVKIEGDKRGLPITDGKIEVEEVIADRQRIVLFDDGDY